MIAEPTYGKFTAAELRAFRDAAPGLPKSMVYATSGDGRDYFNPEGDWFYSAVYSSLPALLDRIAGLEALIAFMDARLPLADATCDEPGITFSVACQREMEEATGE